jgi:hypothetical protein
LTGGIFEPRNKHAFLWKETIKGGVYDEIHEELNDEAKTEGLRDHAMESVVGIVL